MLAAHIDQIIGCCVGVFMAAVGFGWLPIPGRDAGEQQRLLQEHGAMIRFAGLTLIVLSIVLVAFKPTS